MPALFFRTIVRRPPSFIRAAIDSMQCLSLTRHPAIESKLCIRTTRCSGTFAATTPNEALVQFGHWLTAQLQKDPEWKD